MSLELRTKKEIDDTIFKAIYGINGLQKELANLESLMN
jgi:hypothetical protein